MSRILKETYEHFHVEVDTRTLRALCCTFLYRSLSALDYPERYLGSYGSQCIKKEIFFTKFTEKLFLRLKENLL